MYKFPLTTSQKNLIKTWSLTKDKPLFITGLSGCGKSTLAKQLLDGHHIMSIHSDHIRYTGDLIGLIKTTLFKKDVLMMCSTNQYKGLLIEDIQLFIRYDKSGLSKLINFVKTIHSRYPIILVSSNISHKHIDVIRSISYTINMNFSMKFYKTILQKGDIPGNKLEEWIKQSDKNLNTLKVQGYHTNVIDKKYTLNDVIQLLFTENMDCVDLFRLCSSEYNALSLNILENAPFIIKSYDIDILTRVYASICMGDFMESRYIDKDIDIDTTLLFTCVLPRNHIRSAISMNSRYKFKYNSYISKSLIQIHNQSLLSSIDYMNILHLIHGPRTKDIINEILEKISIAGFDRHILDKQIKVYNYYFNKSVTKKQVHMSLDSIL